MKIVNIIQAMVKFIQKDKPNTVWIEKGKYLENNETIPKIIWIYWDSKEKNYLVDFCIFNTKKICADYQIIVLNKDNVSEYLDLPKFKEGLQTAVIADYIRLSLLKKYGGIWMDASILLTENFDWFMSKMHRYENFVFYTDDCTTNLKQPITENWFIAARKNSKFICDWLDEFKKCCLSEDPSTYYENYKGSPLIQDIPNTDYLMCYISAAIITAKKSYSILYANSGSVGHYYNYRLKWFSFLIAVKLFTCSEKNIYKPQLIKFTNSTRYYPNLFIQRNMVSSNSIFGTTMKIYNTMIK